MDYCLIGSALLGSNIYLMMKSKDSKIFTNFQKLLNDQQKEIHSKVKDERLNLYLQGLVIGLVLAFLFVGMMKTKSKNNKLCVFVAIALGFNYVYYSLMPKSNYMLLHLDTPEQNAAWLEIYKEMKLRCMLGMIIGFFGYLLLGMGCC